MTKQQRWRYAREKIAEEPLSYSLCISQLGRIVTVYGRVYGARLGLELEPRFRFSWFKISLECW
jgi:hypothetical protein